MGITVIIEQMVVIIALVAIGIILGARGTIDAASSRSISTIVVDICNPALMLTMALSGDITAGHSELMTAGAIAVIFYAILVLVGFLMPRLLRVEKDDRRFYNVMCVYTNVGFIGIPVAYAVLPADGMLCVLICNIMYSVLFYTHGIAILSGGKDRICISNIFSPGTIAGILSILIVWFRIEIPDILNVIVGYEGNATVFLSMLLLGVSIQRSRLWDSLKNIRIWIFILLRMIVFPAMIAIVLKMLEFDDVIVAGMCLMAAMPIGNLPLIQTEKTGGDTNILSGAIAVTTVVSIITITGFMTILV